MSVVPTAPDIPASERQAGEIAWSVSALNTFTQCPYRYAREKIVKDIPFVQGPEAAFGDKVHVALENLIRHGTPIPPELSTYQRWGEAVVEWARVTGSPIEAEREMCVNSAYQLTGWTAPDAWMRCKLDVTISPTPDRRIVLDWKTGKVRTGRKQAEVYAAMLFITEPQVQQVDTMFAFIKFGEFEHDTFTRDQLPALMARPLSLLQEMSRAHRMQDWPKKPSGLCPWCPVTDCEFWRPKKS